MKVLVQRVKNASVEVDKKIVSSISAGMLVFVGVEKGDDKSQADYLSQKISNLRIFEDPAGKMNLSIKDIGGEMLIVSQFTLAGDTTKGNRPGFDNAAKPETANDLYEYFTSKVKEQGIVAKNGLFQAHMQISLLNDGPVTFILERK